MGVVGKIFQKQFVFIWGVVGISNKKKFSKKAFFFVIGERS